MARKKPTGAYDVGYAKPPEHTKFKKGQSGNPRGKPKGKKSLKTILNEELVAHMTINLNGRPTTGPRQQLMFQTLTARAAVGDIQAQKLLIPLILSIIGPEGTEGGKPALSAQDQRILDQLLAEFDDTPTSAQADEKPDETLANNPSNSDDEEHF